MELVTSEIRINENHENLYNNSKLLYFFILIGYIVVYLVVQEQSNLEETQYRRCQIINICSLAWWIYAMISNLGQIYDRKHFAMMKYAPF